MPVRVAVAILTGLFIFLGVYTVYARTTNEIIDKITHPEEGFDRNELSILFKRIGTVEAAKEPQWCKRINLHIQMNGSESSYSIVGTTSLQFGVDYYRKHKATFDRAQARFTIVPPEIILAILRLETYFGRCLGNSKALSALVREYWSYQYRPARRAQALRDIQSLIRLCRKQNCDPNALQSSWAGAIGIAQFLPSSIEAYGVARGGRDTLRTNLYTDIDSIMSIPNYLIKRGWRANNRAAQEDSVLEYNRSPTYVALVFKYANAIRERLLSIRRQN